MKDVWVQRARQQEELEAGQARLETMRAENIHSCGLHPHPLSGTDIVKSPAERLQEQCRARGEAATDAGRFRGQHSGRVGAVDAYPQQEMIEAVSRGSVLDINWVAELLAQGAAQLKRWSTSAEFVSGVYVGKPSRLRSRKYGLRARKRGVVNT